MCSANAILKGSFDKFADSAKRKKGTAEVDAAFLAEIERWRDLLARNFALRNPSLSVRDLNFAVQETIDRIVFLRICEDRGTEEYGRLRSVANGAQTYPRLLELFRAADARYNSGLFHFSSEKTQAEQPDTLTPALRLDDKALKDIIAHLYYNKKNHGRLAGPKILCPAIARGAAFALDSKGDFFFTGSGSGGGGAYGIRLNDGQQINLMFLLGLLNSKLADKFFKLNSTPFRGGWIALTKQHIEVFPIRLIDFTNKSEVQQHGRIVTLVDRMLALVPKRRAEANPQAAAQLDAQIAATDRQLDRLVYDLYGLTDAEIALVEGDGKNP